MIRGLYTAVSGMVAAMRRMEVATNNLANVQTPGYKQDRTASATFGEQFQFQLARQLEARGPLALATLALGPQLDLSQGPLQRTGRALDVALQGPGFLVLDSPGGPRYTRDGSLTVTADGTLVTSTGAVVQGETGPLVLPPGDALAIDPDGTVRVDEAVVGRLQIVEFDPAQEFERVGNNELVPRGGTAPQPATATTVLQGYIEQSNVDLTGVLTTTLALQRAYTANQRAVQQQDELLARAATEIARPPS
ncbi:MAG TPA: flagellar basal-body rod protein FlgF [Chloroflexota bacterium]|jgi:flagellar basal-body rod protein FlgF|nr:flagellar basal-body rod protein FlgF [Chloroflexota bacterium]